MAANITNPFHRNINVRTEAGKKIILKMVTRLKKGDMFNIKL